MNFIKNMDLKNKRVFLRADLNIPISQDGKIIENYKLKQILPTINYIQENGGKVILATHIGRPDPKEHTNFYDETLSTKILIPWFEENGYEIKYKIDLIKAENFSHENFSKILLLENLRFYHGEKGNSLERENFAQILKKLADIYINDAFALIHRDDCSINELILKFSPKDRGFGFLIDKEIKELNKIKYNPEKPFLVILGGNKLETKIPLLEYFLDKDEKTKPNSIIIGGAISYTFLASQGFNMGQSIVDNTKIDFAKKFLEKAKEKDIKILLPIDHVTIFGIQNTKNFQENESAIDIGPDSIKLFSDEIIKAKTIFINGTMGIYMQPESSTGSKEILNTIANSDSYKIAGGGDCIAAINLFNLQDKFNFLSTGGGATLDYLAKDVDAQELPGLKNL
ncbi:phosphoglycerate kinase [Candidatus Dependentiae bacterium]|nr:phosphoglycerate kinase [Candidatus Dependentiae bacterium]MBU4387103.1 phosphoglycerate kinase [Candidatus Dependentiae bacterium]MCG2756515.1 phosphoglycerate kinase [Candidatus Dependentiae bacterium]